MKHISKLLAVILAASILFAFSGCLKYSSNLLESATKQQPDASSTNIPVPSNTEPSSVMPSETASSEDPATLPSETESTTAVPESTTAPVESTTAAPESTSAAPVETTTEVNPASWSKEEIVKFITDAVNKTKAYTGQVSAHRTENVEVSIDALSPNIPAIKSLANSVVSKIIKPTDENLTFSGGKAVNTDGETIPLLLPKRQAFSLPVAGVASASAQKNGNNIQVTIKLVSEKSSLGNLPKYNSASMGYLDPSELDLDVVTISTMDVSYSGSTMVAVVNPDGYVVSANYDIPIGMEATGKALGFSGSLSITARQTEKWQINW